MTPCLNRWLLCGEQSSKETKFRVFVTFHLCRFSRLNWFVLIRLWCSILIPSAQVTIISYCRLLLFKRTTHSLPLRYTVTHYARSLNANAILALDINNNNCQRQEYRLSGIRTSSTAIDIYRRVKDFLCINIRIISFIVMKTKLKFSVF